MTPTSTTPSEQLLLETGSEIAALWIGRCLEDDGMSDTPEAREEGFYWVVLGQNPPEIAYWERSEWWLCGEDRPWQPEAMTVASERLAVTSGMTWF